MSEPSDEFEIVDKELRAHTVPVDVPGIGEIRVLKPEVWTPKPIPETTRPRRRVLGMIAGAVAFGLSKVRGGETIANWLAPTPIFGEKELRIDYDARLEGAGLPIEMSANGLEYVVIRRQPIALLPQNGREVSFKEDGKRGTVVMTEDGPRCSHPGSI